MTALCKLLCLLSSFAIIQPCLSNPFIGKLAFKQPQAGALAPGQATTPLQNNFPVLNKMAQVRAKLLAMFQKKMTELNILMSAFSPMVSNLTTTPQLAAGQQVSPLQLTQIPGLAQLAGSLQSVMPALQAAALNSPVLPHTQPAAGQPVAGVPTATGQPVASVQGVAQPVSTTLVQPPAQAPITPQVQVQPVPVTSPVAQPVASPVQQAPVQAII